MASSDTNISAGELRFLKYHFFVTRWGKEVLFKICSFSFLHEQRKTILEILVDNGIPLSTRRSPFSHQDTRDLNDKLPEDLNVTLLYKICRSLWVKGVNDPGDELKALVKRIRDERNFVSHEQAEMSNIELEEKLRAFQQILEETLDITKDLFVRHSAEIDQLKSEIRIAVPNLLTEIREKYDPSDTRSLQSLREEIENFGSELSEDILRQSRDELLSLYSCLCKIVPFDWLAQYAITDPRDIMVSLRMEENKESLGRHRGKIVGQEEILINKTPNGKEPEVVILSGDAGSGKTTILCSIVESWHKDKEDVKGLSSFQTVLYMQFRDHRHDNFDDYLKGLLPRTVARFTFKLVKSSIIASKCLVLCDGYDEANQCSEKLFEDFLALNCRGLKIVVTTRPGNTLRLTEIVNKGKRVSINLRLLGLKKQDLELLTDKLFGYLVKDNANKQEELKRELLQKINEMDTATSAILQTPLFFNLFVLLYIECPDIRRELSSRTSLYLQLKKHMVRRISNKTGVSCESLEEFDELYEKWSLKNYIQKKYEWSERDVEKFKSEIRCTEVLQEFDAIMSSYFSIKLTRKHLDFEKVYCYTHRSMQEFAVAGVVCDDIILSSTRQKGGNSFELVLRSVGLLSPEDEREGNVILSQELLEVIFYVPGILYSTERNVLYEFIDDIHDFYMLAWDLSLQRFVDNLLIPCAETRLDRKVLESLASRLKDKVARDEMLISKTESLFVLPSLLSKLQPATIKFCEVPRDLSELNVTLQVANQHSIRTEFDLIIYLADFPEFSGRVWHPLDQLAMDVCRYDTSDAEEQDLESLCPISLEESAKELKLTYQMQELSGDRLAQVINRTVPMNRPEGTTDLYVFLSAEHRIKRIIDSLMVRPLRSLTFDKSEPDGDSIQDLRRRCLEKGLGDLDIQYIGF